MAKRKTTKSAKSVPSSEVEEDPQARVVLPCCGRHWICPIWGRDPKRPWLWSREIICPSCKRKWRVVFYDKHPISLVLNEDDPLISHPLDGG